MSRHSSEAVEMTPSILQKLVGNVKPNFIERHLADDATWGQWRRDDVDQANRKSQEQSLLVEAPG